MKKVFFLVAFLFLFLINGSAVLANNLNGYAWSSNIGWISFDGTVVDDVTGDLRGYAWSENIGWIKLNPMGPYPGFPEFSSRIIAPSKVIKGWARACAGAANGNCSGGTNPDSGGWDGWIKFSDTDYSVEESTDDQSQCYLSGYAWGSSVLGWIKFSSDYSRGRVSLNSCVAGGMEEEVVPPPPNTEPIDCTFSAYPTRLIPPKKTTRLTWTCSNADDYICAIAPTVGVVEPASGGSILATLSSTTNYRLRCENSAGDYMERFAPVTVLKSRICETIPYFPGCQ